MVRVEVSGGVPAGAAWCLVLLAVVLRLRGGRRGPIGRTLSPVEVGLLRGGPRGAAQTGLVELYLAGAVQAGWRQTVRRVEARPLPRGCSEATRAQYNALFGRMHPRRLQGLDQVRHALREAAGELERAGLLVSRRRVRAVRILLLPVFAAAPLGALWPSGPAGSAGGGQGAGWLWLGLLADAGALALWVRPRRTRRGAAELARLRREHPAAGRATEREPDALLLSVALSGAPALRAQLPRFTEESGLLTRPPGEPLGRGGGGGSGDPLGSCGGCGG